MFVSTDSPLVSHSERGIACVTRDKWRDREREREDHLEGPKDKAGERERGRERGDHSSLPHQFASRALVRARLLSLSATTRHASSLSSSRATCRTDSGLLNRCVNMLWRESERERERERERSHGSRHSGDRDMTDTHTEREREREREKIQMAEREREREREERCKGQRETFFSDPSANCCAGRRCDDFPQSIRCH